MMISLIYLPPENPKDRLILTATEEQELLTFDHKVNILHAEKLVRLREMARLHGITAEKLTDLKSRSGEPFIVTGKDHYEDYRKACTSRQGEVEFEYAYLCASPFFQQDVGCGWVRGVPKADSYDHIGLLSGSAGVTFRCWICNAEVGKVQEKFSLALTKRLAAEPKE
jgi:hypothetical protein